MTSRHEQDQKEHLIVEIADENTQAGPTRMRDVRLMSQRFKTMRSINAWRWQDRLKYIPQIKKRARLPKGYSSGVP